MKTLSTHLNEKISHPEPIQLSPHTSTRIPLALFCTFLALSLLTGYYLIHSHGANALFFGFLGCCITGALYFLSFIWRIIGSAYIKADMLIVKYAFGKFKVTDLRSIRGVKTTSILGIRLTSIRFKVDGVLYKVILLGNARYLGDPKKIIESLRNAA